MGTVKIYASGCLFASISHALRNGAKLSKFWPKKKSRDLDVTWKNKLMGRG